MIGLLEYKRSAGFFNKYFGVINLKIWPHASGIWSGYNVSLLQGILDMLIFFVIFRKIKISENSYLIVYRHNVFKMNSINSHLEHLFTQTKSK